MTQRITIIEDVFDPATWLVRESDDIRNVLTGHFAHWPANGRLYHGHIANDHEVTPLDERDWDKLPEAPGPFFMVVTPDAAAAIIAVVAIGLSLLATFLLMPVLPSVSQSTGSSSNELSGRQNKPRPLQRIPDILGQVRSTPDLLGVPLKVFENKQEVEYAYLCVGRGAYEISEVRDDTTLVSELQGASVEIYGPDTSPLSGSPETLIGDAITEPLVSVRASTAINGQVLYAPNYKSINMATIIVGGVGGRFQADGKINAPALDWKQWFEKDDMVTVTGATYTESGSGLHVNLDGTYKVKNIGGDGSLLEFDHPELVNTDWNIIAGMADARTDFLKPLVEVQIEKTIGPFTLAVDDLAEVIANVVAAGGLYTVNGDGTQERIDVDIRMDLVPLNADGTPAGSTETFTFTVPGAASTRSLLGLSCRANPTFTGRCSVSLTRTSWTIKDTGLQVVDEIKWRDLYAISPIDATDFGNVTTIYSRSLATPAALGLKERKLNVLATRKVPARDGDGFTTGLAASRSVADIFCFAALDPFIGGRSLSELNVAQIYDEIAAAQLYFGNAEAVEFGFTFDDDGTSFEETAAAIAEAAFCTARRYGSMLELTLEKATTDSVILFNHRNKKPGSETRTISFGNLNDYDGVEYNWVDKDNFDGPAVYRIPEDGSAVRPKKIDSVGQRNLSQVHWHAWREYNKIIYQHVAVEFTTLPEASLVGRLDRILVADNTRSETQDGEVVSQDGLILTLSRRLDLDPDSNYRIFLQIPNGTVDAIDIEAGDTSNQVILANAPSSPLSLESDRYARATFWIVPDDDGREQAFLVSEKTQQDNSTFTVSAVNYDARYYERDGELVTDESGRLIRDVSGRTIAAV